MDVEYLNISIKRKKKTLQSRGTTKTREFKNALERDTAICKEKDITQKYYIYTIIIEINVYNEVELYILSTHAMINKITNLSWRL